MNYNTIFISNVHLGTRFSQDPKKSWYKKYWSLSKYVKDNIKSSVSFITDFEAILAEHAKRKSYDGIICGHIHKAEMKNIGEIEYLNCGDWVESCTAVVEHTDGRFEILHWDQRDE